MKIDQYFKFVQEFKKLVNQKLNLNSSKVKIPKRNSEFLYLCFRSEENKNAALTTLNGYKWKNVILDASVSNFILKVSLKFYF